MTNDELRDMFAAHAIAGAAIKEGASIAADTGHTERVARKAYAIADAMIVARAEATGAAQKLEPSRKESPAAIEPSD